MMKRGRGKKIIITFAVFISGVFLLSLGAVGTKNLKLKESTTKSEFYLHQTGNYEKYKNCTDRCYREWWRCQAELWQKYKDCIRKCKEGDYECKNYCNLYLKKKGRECDQEYQACMKRCEKYI